MRARTEGAMKRIGIVTNVWGWSLRGIRHWLSCWAWPYSVHGVEVTREMPAVYRVGYGRLRVIRHVTKIGPICIVAGHHTEGYHDGQPAAFDASGSRELRYPYGRWQAWRSRRYNARIDRDNRRRADERAMREGCS
jgi:hypothetical protein